MRRSISPVQRTELALLLLFSVLAGLVILAPFTLPPGSVTDLSGHTNVIDNQDQMDEMNPLAAAVYWLGDANCHQKAARSYYLNQNQMPFCARDLGIFLGLVMGMAAVIVVQRRPPLWLPVLGLVPMALDGGWQLLTEYESTNIVRLATGILAGMSVALMIHLLALTIAQGSRDRRRKDEGASR
jgi:uncharacterized membrane protein